MPDFIPRNDGAFDKWYKFLIQFVEEQCTGSPPVWTHIPQPARTELQNFYAEWYTAYGKTLKPCTKAEREAKNLAKTESMKKIRVFVNKYLRYEPVTNAQRTEMSIRNRDTVPTNHPPPESQPETVVENTTNHFEHRVRSLNRGRNDTTKPADAYGVRYAWQVGGERPASAEDLPKTTFSRKTSVVITHTEAEKKETAWYASCYENAKGERGPWSPIVEAVIG